MEREIGSSPRNTLKAALQEVIGAAEPAQIEATLDTLWTMVDLAVQQPPETGLVMMAIRDPFDTPFYLGEVLVTSARVACTDVMGHGTVMGNAPRKALLLAAVEALERCRQEHALGVVARLVAQLALRATQRKKHIARMAAATAVRFDSMRKEQVDFGSMGG